MQLESPILGEDADSTLQALHQLRAALTRNDIPLTIVADDWCNTIEDITRFLDAGAADLIQIKTPDRGALTNAVRAAAGLPCGRRRGVHRRILLRDRCERACERATRGGGGAEQVLAKPGMGVDEAVAITRNEMQRACM